MNINNSLNPYNSNLVNNTDVTKMSQGQSIVLVPAIKDCILKVDVEGKRVDMHLLKGLAD